MIITTDNGGMPWHNQTQNNAYNFSLTAGCNYPLRGGKVTMFQGGVRVLGLITGPLVPSEAKGTENPNFFNGIDWLPTILSYVGHPELIPSNLDGKDVSSFLWDNKETFNRTQMIIWENFDEVQELQVSSLIEGAVIDKGWKYIHGSQIYNCYYPAPPAPIECLHNVTNFTSDKYLFYLPNDPYEMNNLIEKYPEKGKELAEIIVNDAITQGYKYNELDLQWNASCPQFHDGAWVPWLDDGPENDFLRPCNGL